MLSSLTSSAYRWGRAAEIHRGGSLRFAIRRSAVLWRQSTGVLVISGPWKSSRGSHAFRARYFRSDSRRWVVCAAQYGARLRMHLASVWLRKERATVVEVATRLGYDSETS